MSEEQYKWSKEELQTYILLLCANADNNESEEEINMIQSKVPTKTFLKIYAEFKNDSEEEQLEKIENAVNKNTYTEMELAAFRREIYHVFFSDCNFTMMEKRLDWTLDNILY
ncbi:hypothetical protein [Winogradskyella ouciana]|uniref:TerB family tellurite resistance protein n=1 Tax=Winogradskyella ouciana TaxID=2608631 RepID=A0A7K1GFI8_9FLAO|nr:hypothetical protein [Winogradskyella ouciana]MTE27851.1 hypothetical protein [Winogradskyella ouciana]